jgi:hypothetical protein
MSKNKNLKFAIPEIAESFSEPLNPIQQRFNKGASIQRYFDNLKEDAIQIIEHLNKADREEDRETRAFLLHCLELRILFQYIVDVFDYVYKSGLSFPSKHSQHDDDEGREDDTVERETEPPKRPKRIDNSAWPGGVLS